MVRQEERYHRLDDARRCLTSAKLPDGWWSSAPLPDPQRPTTSVVNVPGRAHTIVWNSDAAVLALLRWGYGRFAEAGLPAPAAPFAWVEKDDMAACLAAPHRVHDLFLTICTTRSPTCVDQTCASCYGTCYYSCPCTETCATCDTCPPCI
jgi:hypothetical protein